MSINDKVKINIEEFLQTYVRADVYPMSIHQIGESKVSPLQTLANRIILDCRLCFRPKGIDKKIKEAVEAVDTKWSNRLEHLYNGDFNDWVQGEMTDKEFALRLQMFFQDNK